MNNTINIPNTEMNSQNASRGELLDELQELQEKYAVMEELLAKNNIESTDKFKIIFEQAAVGIAQIDTQTGKFIKINQKYAQLIGYTVEEMLTIDFQIITFPEDLAEDLQNMELLKKGEIREFTIEKRYIHKDGHIIWVGLSVASLWEKGNFPDFHSAVITDITERKQTELALIKERLRFQDIVDATDGIVWEVDYVTFLFTYVSQKAVRLLGYDLEEWYQQDFWTSHIHGEDKKWAIEYCSLHSERLEPHEFEYRFFAKDGRIVWLRDIVTVVSDKNKPKFLCGIMIDITEQKKIEETLRISEQRLKTIIETEPECVKIVSVKGELLEMNTAGLAMLEANSLEELKSYSPTLLKLILPKYHKEYNNLYQRAFNGENGLLEFEVLGLKGTQKWFETHVAPLRDKNNKITSMLAVTHDITRRKLAELALKEKEKSLNLAQSIAKIGSWELDLINYESVWSKENYAIFELEKLPPKQIFEAFRKKMHLDDIPLFDKAIQEIITTRKKSIFEHRIVCKDKTIKYIESIGNVVVNENNEVVRLWGTSQDITARKIAEKEIAKLALVAKYTDNMVIITNPYGYIEWVNQAFITVTEYSLEEVVGNRASSFLTGEKTNLETINFMRQCFVEQKSFNVEIIGYKKSGMEYWVQIESFPVYDEYQEVINYIAIERDITERKNAEEQLKNQNKILQLQNSELEQFTYITSHDLQEPLHTIVSFAELFQEEYLGKVDGNAELYINFMVKSSKRMQELVKGLLDYSRIGQEREKINIDCRQLINDVIADMTATIVASKAEIIVEDLPIIQGYPIELRLLFQNLLSNALKFTAKDIIPKINISAKSIAHDWLFSVQDNGIGIDEKDYEKIFIIFKRLHNRDEYEGTGIGLSHCKKIVALHGGTIWVKNYDKGSIFYFTIPKKETLTN